MLGVFLLVSLVISVSGAHETYSKSDFPPGFVFGVGTSAYQVEGAANEDGRTPSIFDTFAHSGITDGGTGDVACDQYHKYKEDVQLMVELGLDAYRFSISWSRLIPNGRGKINPKGLQYYSNLINELLRNGIQPHVTLNHFDMPQALEDEYGGWISLKIVEDFTAYADACFRMFGDRVKYWTTFNEANIFVVLGYGFGLLPPQRCSYSFAPFNCTRGNSSMEPYTAAHNILLSHASAARLYKEKYQSQQKGYIGFNIYTCWFESSTNTDEDIAATQRAMDYFIGWFAHPLVYGDYPDIMKKNAGSRIPSFTALESDSLKGSFDFLGLNYYTSVQVKDKPQSLNKEPRDLMAEMAIEFDTKAILKNSSFEYPITPWGLQGVLEYFKLAYGNPPVYIHENGQRMRRNETLEDWPRVESMQEYIGAVLDSVRNGSNTRGFFEWSLLDVFEVNDGFKTSFGLYYVDLDDPDLKRYAKLSAHWYSHFLKGGVVPFDSVIELVQKVSSPRTGHTLGKSLHHPTSLSVV